MWYTIFCGLLFFVVVVGVSASGRPSAPLDPVGALCLCRSFCLGGRWFALRWPCGLVYPRFLPGALRQSGWVFNAFVACVVTRTGCNLLDALAGDQYAITGVSIPVTFGRKLTVEGTVFFVLYFKLGGCCGVGSSPVLGFLVDCTGVARVRASLRTFYCSWSFEPLCPLG